jgi:hypothetical protein
MFNSMLSKPQILVSIKRNVYLHPQFFTSNRSFCSLALTDYTTTIIIIIIIIIIVIIITWFVL